MEVTARTGPIVHESDANVADAVFLINYVFSGGSAPDPIEAGDANGEGDVNIADAVYIKNYVFKGGAAPIPLEAGDANCDFEVNVGDAVDKWKPIPNRANYRSVAPNIKRVD